MTVSYSGDPSASAKDQIRFQLGDTDVTDAQLQDAEITWAFNLRGNAWGATAMCALALAAKYSRLTSVSADGVSQQLQQKAAQYRAIAQEYERKEALYTAAPYVAGVSVADMIAALSDTDRVPDIFRLGMNDDPPSLGVAPENDNPLGAADIAIGLVV